MPARDNAECRSEGIDQSESTKAVHDRGAFRPDLMQSDVRAKSKCWCGDRTCHRVVETDRRGAFRFELIAATAIGAAFVFLLLGGAVEPNELYAAWFMPVLGVIAATIAMSTPAGGGVVFFPTMVLLGVPPIEAVAFSVGAQAIGMGVFGTFNWIKRDRSAIQPEAVLTTALIGGAATLLALFVFPIVQPRPLQLTFSFAGLGLAIYIWYGLRHRLDQSTSPFRLDRRMLATLAAVGLVGGLFVGYVGVGVDALLFLALTAFFRIDSHDATVTSIVTMGLTAMVPFGIHLLVLQDVPIHLLLMVLPGILFGARIGPWLNQRLGRRPILIVFSVLLLIEFLMTFTRQVILS